MPDDHSEVVPLLPIPNRTVKRLRADDSAGSRVKVGHRQAPTAKNAPSFQAWGVFIWAKEIAIIRADRILQVCITRPAVRSAVLQGDVLASCDGSLPPLAGAPACLRDQWHRGCLGRLARAAAGRRSGWRRSRLAGLRWRDLRKPGGHANAP